MKTKRIITTAITLFTFLTLFSQESILSSGGVAKGSGGSVSYSAGQVFYSTSKGSNATVSQGVQQPYEISVLSAIDDISQIDLDITAYPNPATDLLRLKIKDKEINGLSYRLFDMNGNILEHNKVEDIITTIDMKLLPSSVYFLKVLIDNKDVKTFKIIKH